MKRYKIDNIYLENYKLFEKRTIEFNSADLVVLDGPNGYGKTSIFEAIEYLLTGNIKRAEQCPEVLGNIAYDTHFLAKDSKKKVIVRGEFISEQNILKIERTIDVVNISRLENNPKKLKSVTNTKIWFNDEIISYDIENIADNIIKEYLGENLEDYYDSFYYISQEDRLKFLMSSDSKRMAQLSSLFNIDDEINRYLNYDKLKKEIAKKITKQKKINKETKEDIEKIKEGLKEDIKDKKSYIDVFKKNEQKPYWNEKIVKIKDKSKLEEVLDELKKIAVFTRNKDYFEKSLSNSILRYYLDDLDLLKNMFVFRALQEDFEGVERIYEEYKYLNSLTLKDNSDEIDIENIDYKTLKAKMEIDTEIDTIIQIQNEIITLRSNQSTYDKSLEKLKNARNNLSKSLDQWKLDGGKELGENVCPYCGNTFNDKNEYDISISAVQKVLEDCNVLESNKIKNALEKMQKLYDEKFKNSISEFMNKNFFMKNDTVQNIIKNLKSFKEKYNKFYLNMGIQKISIKEYGLQLDNPDTWNDTLVRFVQMVETNYIQPLTEEYINREKEYAFFNIYQTIFQENISNIGQISEKDENEKRLYLEEQYQLQEQIKIDDMEKELKKNEDMTMKLGQMRVEVDKVASIYKEEIGRYEKKIIGEIQIPLYIYSGRVLQYFQGGLGIFIKYDTKKEKLDTIRLVSAKKADHDVLYTLSSGQLTGVVIAFTLALNKIYGSDKFPCILIDDPVQTMDDLNIASLVELFRNEFRNYQMIVSTHEENFSRFIRYKYKKYNLTTKKYPLNKEA